MSNTNQGIGWSQESKLLQYILNQLKRVTEQIYSLVNSSVSSASIVTTVGDPGSDTNIPSEKAVRTELNGLESDISTLQSDVGTLQDDKQDKLVTIISESSGSFQIGATHLDNYVRVSFGTDVYAIVPLNATLAIPVGTVVTLFQVGAGVVTLAGETAGVTLNAYDSGLSTTGQYAGIQLTKVATNEWDVIGGVSYTPITTTTTTTTV